MCVGKQMISFGFGEKLLSWVAQSGYATICGIFTGVLLANNLALFIFMFYGKRIRTYYAGTWLARMHRRSVKQIMAA